MTPYPAGLGEARCAVVDPWTGEGRRELSLLCNIMFLFVYLVSLMVCHGRGAAKAVVVMVLRRGGATGLTDTWDGTLMCTVSRHAWKDDQIVHRQAGRQAGTSS